MHTAALVVVLLFAAGAFASCQTCTNNGDFWCASTNQCQGSKGDCVHGTWNSWRCERETCRACVYDSGTNGFWCLNSNGVGYCSTGNVEGGNCFGGNEIDYCSCISYQNCEDCLDHGRERICKWCGEQGSGFSPRCRGIDVWTRSNQACTNGCLDEDCCDSADVDHD